MATQKKPRVGRLEDIQAKRCLTAAGWLLKNSRVLLVKHKMLGVWLAPGGHVEPDELPHQAATREFFEETGVKVHAISARPVVEMTDTQNLPLPFVYNLHWINRPGETKKNPHSGRICEQHYVFSFFVETDGELNINDSDIGVDAVQWFSEDEIDGLQTMETIKSEAHQVFKHYPQK